MPRENCPCEGGIAGQHVNRKRNWELEMHIDGWCHNDVGLATARVNCSLTTLTVLTEEGRDANYRMRFAASFRVEGADVVVKSSGYWRGQAHFSCGLAVHL